ncbi:uncharacterized protein [Spinacia oleracea]|uniref:OTU domain-containing protein n=1 Tax=Spinacia oleracea TaxID=3562 RepID=A0ABM3RGY1_SPIOL|nr:uncharacterized protein LOC130469542 [Spinacia oleracea]
MGDGNCGFRCLADFFLGDQDKYVEARKIIANEVGANRWKYQHIHHGGVDEAMRRIKWPGGHCTSDHYMEVMEDLFPIAQFWNCAVILLGVQGGSLYPCMTILPWDAECNVTQPSREIFILHLIEYNYFIRLDLSPGCPIPPLADLWFMVREPSVIGWEQIFQHRIAEWQRLETLV